MFSLILILIVFFGAVAATLLLLFAVFAVFMTLGIISTSAAVGSHSNSPRKGFETLFFLGGGFLGLTGGLAIGFLCVLLLNTDFKISMMIGWIVGTGGGLLSGKLFNNIWTKILDNFMERRALKNSTSQEELTESVQEDI